MKYFAGVHTLNELKAAYRRLALQHHPDRGGDPEAMKAINAEHDALFDELKRRHNAAAGTQHQTTETAAEFREIVEKLLALDGLEVELCGAWLWIGGNTMEHKEALKAMGCRWSSKKKLWYWHHPEEGRKWRRGGSTMSEIRSKYGSQTFRSSGSIRLEEATA